MMDNDLIFFFPNPLPKWANKAENFVKKILKNLNVPGYDFSITFCDNQKIHELNRDFRRKDEPTDVLSFEAEGLPEQRGWVLGDLFISLEMLKTNSEYFSVEPEQELKRLLIHGILHLLGWDHSDNTPGQPMLKFQEEILKGFDKEDWF